MSADLKQDSYLVFKSSVAKLKDKLSDENTTKIRYGLSFYIRKY